MVDHWSTSLYAALVRSGVDPHDWEVNYDDEDTDGTAMLALPESRVAICVDGDNSAPLEEDGWLVVRVNISAMESFAKVYQALHSTAVEHTRRLSSQKMIKTGSKEEERILAAILRANLKEPDRNFKVLREDGTELTTPDFVWEDLKIAFFMDGQWWHHGLDDKAKKDQLLNADEDQVDHASAMSRTRAQRDAENRSELAVLGWRILQCTDADVADDEGVRKQVERIQRMMRTVKSEQAVAPPRPKESKTKQEIDLLDMLD